MEGRLIVGRRWNDLNEVDSNIDDASEDSVPTSIQILDGFFYNSKPGLLPLTYHV